MIVNVIQHRSVYPLAFSPMDMFPIHIVEVSAIIIVMIASVVFTITVIEEMIFIGSLNSLLCSPLFQKK